MAKNAPVSKTMKKKKKNKKDPKNSIVHKLSSQFSAGLLVTIPISASVILVVWLFLKVDNLLKDFLSEYLGISFYGVGIIALILIIWFVGIITRSWLGSKMLHFYENLIGKIPILGKLFTTIKQLSNSVIGKDKSSFTQAVLVEVFGKGKHSIAFITSNENVVITETGKRMIHIFVPTAPNPTSGFLMLVEESNLIKLKIPVEQAFQAVVSAGMVYPSEYY